MLITLGNSAYAVIEASQFADKETEQRYQTLIAELRCLVCQNQNLADSDAGLAKDLRRKASEMLIDGKSDQEILDYMQERYGDFVLYNPPFNMTTAFLWLGPFVLLLIASLGVWKLSRRSRGINASEPLVKIDSDTQDKIRSLLSDKTDSQQAVNSTDNTQHNAEQPEGSNND